MKNEKKKDLDRLDFIHRYSSWPLADGGSFAENTYINRKNAQLTSFPGVAAWFDSLWVNRTFRNSAPHGDLVFTFIVSGKMYYEYDDGRVKVLQAGDFHLPPSSGKSAVPPGKALVRVKKEEPLFRLGLILKRTAVLEALLPLLNRSGQEIRCTQPEAVKEIMLAMKEEICAKRGSNERLGILLLELLQELLRQLDSCALPLPLQKAVRTVSQEGFQLSPEDLAKSSGVSKRTLQNLFRDHMHCTPAEYLASQRMEYAKTLLRSRSLMISEVAALCGFSSAEAFSRAFKSRVGTTPRNFMEQESGLFYGKKT